MRPVFPARLAVPTRPQSTQPPARDEGEQNIFQKLSERFSPVGLQVEDMSGGCGTFYAISITSESFRGMPVIKQHRLVNDTLKKEIAGIHGLQLKTAVPPS